LNQLSFIKIKFDSTQYDFKTLNNIIIRGNSGTYTGMINKTSVLPSGFGRFKRIYDVWDGQFYEGKFYGVSRWLSTKSMEYN